MSHAAKSPLQCDSQQRAVTISDGPLSIPCLWPCFHAAGCELVWLKRTSSIDRALCMWYYAQWVISIVLQHNGCSRYILDQTLVNLRNGKSSKFFYSLSNYNLQGSILLEVPYRLKEFGYRHPDVNREYWNVGSAALNIVVGCR